MGLGNRIQEVMKTNRNAIDELSDEQWTNTELRRKLKTAEQDLNNAELRIAGLLRELGRPVENEDVIKPNC